MADENELVFEWDRRKAAWNVKVHGITFDEASTVFRDSLGMTIDDPDHSGEETRLLQLGMSLRRRLIVYRLLTETVEFELSAPVHRHRRSEETMKKQSKQIKRYPDGMRYEYDFSKGVRGKYAAQYAAGTNVVVLEPDIVKEFASSAEVNDTLRTLLRRRKNGNKKKTA